MSFIRVSSCFYCLSYESFKYPFQIIRFVKSGNLFLDFKPVRYVNYSVPLGRFITINPRLHNYLKLKLLYRLRKRAVLFTVPKFLFVSYKFFYSYIMKLPMRKDFVYPISLDIQRITGYY